MSSLLEKLNAILEEKKKITPDIIKEGNVIFGVPGYLTEVNKMSPSEYRNANNIASSILGIPAETLTLKYKSELISDQDLEDVKNPTGDMLMLKPVFAEFGFSEQVLTDTNWTVDTKTFAQLLEEYPYITFLYIPAMDQTNINFFIHKEPWDLYIQTNQSGSATQIFTQNKENILCGNLFGGSSASGEYVECWSLPSSGLHTPDVVSNYDISGSSMQTEYDNMLMIFTNYEATNIRVEENQ